MINYNSSLHRLLELQPLYKITYSIDDSTYEILDTLDKAKAQYDELANRSPINGHYVTLIKDEDVYYDFALPHNFLELFNITFQALSGENILLSISESNVEQYIAEVVDFLFRKTSKLSAMNKQIVKAALQLEKENKWHMK